MKTPRTSRPSRSRSPLPKFAAATLALTLATTACGLKPEAMQALRQSGGGSLAGNDGLTGDGTGVDGGLGSGGTGGTGSGGTGGTGSGGTGGTGSGGTGGTGGTGTGANPNNPNSPNNPNNPNVPGGGITTGIRGDTIWIGLHAPITGAAPIPNESFQRGKELFWINRTVLGYKVKVTIENDQYRPSVARQKCEKLAADHFLVIGGAGTDQIQSCATDQVLRAKRTPYLSAGVTTNGLIGLPDYFAVSTTYAEQARLVVKNAKSNPADFPSGTWAIVTTGTDNFKDARESIKKELTDAGIAWQARETSKDESSSDAQQTAAFLNTNRFPVVYFLTSPSYFVQVLGGLVPGYNPTFTGVGVSMGLNTVARLACQKTSAYRGYFLSPTPGLDVASQNGEFTSRAGGDYDDLMYLLYGISEVVYQAMSKVSLPLTREKFISTLERSTLTFSDRSFPPLSYTPTDHFGGSQAWMLKSDCSYSPPGGDAAGAYRTVGNAPLKP